MLQHPILLFTFHWTEPKLSCPYFVKIKVKFRILNFKFRISRTFLNNSIIERNCLWESEDDIDPAAAFYFAKSK